MKVIIIGDQKPPEIWQPSVQLRFVERFIIPQKVLQQLHTSNLGNRKWIDVPTEKEE